MRSALDAAGTGLAHHIAGLIRSLSDPVGS